MSGERRLLISHQEGVWPDDILLGGPPGKDPSLEPHVGRHLSRPAGPSYLWGRGGSDLKENGGERRAKARQYSDQAFKFYCKSGVYIRQCSGAEWARILVGDRLHSGAVQQVTLWLVYDNGEGGRKECLLARAGSQLIFRK